MTNITYAAVTHPGKVRGGNEDNLYVQGKYRADVDQGTFETQGSSSAAVFRVAVFDGMGGEAYGELASLYASEELNRFDGEYPDVCLSEDPMVYFDPVNNRICERIEQNHQRMGTTAAVVEFSDNKAVAINIGDSRIYLFKENHLTQISVDHTTVGHMLRSGRITKEEAEKHKLKHQLSQHLGISPEEMILEPAVSEPIELGGGEIFLLCSDGLTDMVSDEEIEKILAGGTSLQIIAEKLRDLALANGGKDNVTVLLAQATNDGSSASANDKKLIYPLIGIIGILIIVLICAVYNRKSNLGDEEKSTAADSSTVESVSVETSSDALECDTVEASSSVEESSIVEESSLEEITDSSEQSITDEEGNVEEENEENSVPEEGDDSMPGNDSDNQ